MAEAAMKLTHENKFLHPDKSSLTVAIKIRRQILRITTSSSPWSSSYITKLLCSLRYACMVWEWTLRKNWNTFLWCVVMREKAKWRRHKSTSSVSRLQNLSTIKFCSWGIQLHESPTGWSLILGRRYISLFLFRISAQKNFCYHFACNPKCTFHKFTIDVKKFVTRYKN